MLKLHLCICTDLRLKDVYFLTNKESTITDPSADGNGGWSKCYYSPTALGEQYNITCDTNPQRPIVTQFAVAARTTAIELREVEIYGHGVY